MQLAGLQAEARFFLKYVDGMERVKRLGGLHVIGCTRHEARRIDQQLRGRAARQGDPGSSRFFISMEDELMVRFGGLEAQAFLEDESRRGGDPLLPVPDGSRAARGGRPPRTGWKARISISASTCWNTTM